MWCRYASFGRGLAEPTRLTLILLAVCTFAWTELFAAPVIVVQPEDRRSTEDSLITLSVEATGIASFSYQWYQGESRNPNYDRLVDGASSASYTPPILTYTSGWWVRVTDATGSTDSRVATVEVVETVGFEKIVSWPGFRYGIASAVGLSGDYAYVLAGSLQVFDVRDPAQPFRVGAHDPGGHLHGLHVADGFAFSVGTYGMDVLDLGEPKNPNWVSRVDLLGAVDVTVEERRAYVAAQSYGLSIVDVTDPFHPVLLGTYKDGGIVRSVKVVNRHAYIADGNLKVIDVNDPQRPVLVGLLPDLYGGVDVSGDFAYIFGKRTLTIVDVSDPTQPVAVGSLDHRLQANLVRVQDGLAFLCGTESGLKIVDVSDPRNPREVSEYRGRDSIRAVSVDGNYAYLAANHDGLAILDVRDPMNLSEIGHADTYRQIWGVQVNGHYAFVTETVFRDKRKFVVLDVSDPGAPVIVTRYDAGTEAYLAHVGDGRLYIVTGWRDVETVDVTDPTAPARIGLFRARGHPAGVDVAGQHMYLAAGPAGLLVVDIGDPSSPRETAQLDTGGWTGTVQVQGDVAFVCDYRGGFSVVDISNPGSPRKIGSYADIERALSVSVSGTVAYVSTSDFWTLVLDVSDFSRPTAVNRLSASSVLPMGNLAYAKRYGAGYAVLQVLDVRRPLQLVQLGEYWNSGGIDGYDVRDRFVYLTTGQSLEVHFVSGGPPVITRQPQDEGAVFDGPTQTLTVGAWGEPLSYQWYRGDSGDVSHPISSAVQSTSLVMVPPAPVSRFWVRVSNQFGAVDSRTATITAQPRLALASQISPTDSALSIEITAPPGTRWRLERSAEMRSWEVEPTVEPFLMEQWSGRVVIPSNASHGFYRAVWIP